MIIKYIPMIYFDWEDNLNLIQYFHEYFWNLEALIYKTTQKTMLMYSSKSKPALNQFISPTSPTQNCYRSGPFNPKNLPYCPPAPIILNKISLDIVPKEILTPKTSRPLYPNFANTNSPCSKSINTTPQKDRNNQNKFSTANSKFRQAYIVESVQANQLDNFKMQIPKTDNFQKTLKDSIGIGSNAKCDFQKAKLRLTVNISHSGQYKDLACYSPIKNSNKVASPVTPKGDENFFRKKIQSQYKSSYPQETVNKQIKSKFSTAGHSRQTSRVEKYPKNTASTGHFSFRLNNLSSNQNTPINSKEKLSESSHIPKGNIMNKTNSNGNFFRRPSNIRSKSIRKLMENTQLKLQDFQLGPCKGEGCFGKVFPARHIKTGFLVAIKQIKKQSVKLMLNQFIQQLKISLFINHPNVVKMYTCFSSQANFYIVMEYMQEGSLYKTIKMNRKLSEGDVVSKLHQICEAVKYLHQLDILHRDIKPENVVLSNGVCKLCDFGWATYSKQRRSTYCGTLDYVCPQILQGQTYDNFVDIWAIGVLAYEMLTGKAPFYHVSRKQTMKNIMKCDFTFPTDMSLPAKLFITKALQKKPDQRFTVELLLQDNFLADLNAKK